MPAALPPELLNNEGYARSVWRDRTPLLVIGLRDAHPFDAGQRRALEALLAEVTSGPIRPLGPDAPDHDVWATGHFGRPWRDAPFLWSESYFYRRILDATGFFRPGPWHGVDPYAHQKNAELDDPALDAELDALADDGRLILLASLWGNRADLTFQIGRDDDHTAAPREALVADDGDRLWAALGPAAGVVLVADNAGRELLADLVLADHLLAHRLAATVALHVKPQPYYVSDATTADVLACLRRLSRAGAAAAQVAERLRQAAAEGRFTPYTHAFYCAPWSYHRMPADLAGEFARATVTILKGDLNYRRLVGDRAWPPTVPFGEVAGHFPGPVAALRTCKSDVMTGLDPATIAALDATGTAWRTDGTHALLQFSG